MSGLEQSMERRGELVTETQPAGELAERVRLILDRLTGPGFPAYSPEFVLADVRLDLDYPRLYDSFSGDISGRYVEALALMGEESLARLEPLVPELLRCQREDGRFGDARLSFAAADIEKPQMALLWGNGRLLVGLLAYHQVTGDPAVLESARRLGDFLVRVRNECSETSVARRVHGLGAHGLICFTQLIEGLVLLGRATGDTTYFQAAREIVPLLPPPGIQHTHGYLSTLRGMLLLHEATGDPTLLAEAERKYQELVASPDYVVFGGVLEFFGAETHGLSPADLDKLFALDNKPPQDEGCSEADFVRLSLQLWRATGCAGYLERAERCLLNQFYANQFRSGDFGHRVVYHRGFRPSDNPGKAWWCCNMHGLRTFPDVAEAIVTGDGDTVWINLFLDCTQVGESLSLSIQQATEWDGVRIGVRGSSTGPVTLAVRQPSWVTSMQLRVNGEEVEGKLHEGYLSVRRDWTEGDRLDVEYTYRACLRRRNGEYLEPGELGSDPVEAALFYGPWLMGVHEADEPAFLERPWTWGVPNENLVSLPADLETARIPVPATEGGLLQPRVAIRLPYRHGGWPGEAEVTLRPISRQTAVSHQQVLAVWITYRRTES